MSRRRAGTRRNTLTGYLGRTYRMRRDIVLEETGSRPLNGRRITQVNVGDLTRARAVRAGVERRGDAVTIIRIRVRHHRSPPSSGFRPARYQSGPVANPSSQKQNCLQFVFATFDPPQVPSGPIVVSEKFGAGNSDRSHARSPFASGFSRHQATDSRSHLPMSAEPLLFSERVAENVRAHVSKYTTRPAGQFRFVGQLQRDSCAACRVMSEFSTARQPTC